MKTTGYLRILAFLAVGCLVIPAQTGCGRSDPNAGTLSNPQSLDPVEFRLTIDFGEQRESVTGAIETTEKMTVLDLLLAVAAENQLAVDYDGRSSSAFVNSIGGIVGGGDGNPWWIYSVNGQLAQESSGSRVLRPGDHVHWHMGKYPE